MAKRSEAGGDSGLRRIGLLLGIATGIVALAGAVYGGASRVAESAARDVVAAANHVSRDDLAAFRSGWLPRLQAVETRVRRMEVLLYGICLSLRRQDASLSCEVPR